MSEAENSLSKGSKSDGDDDDPKKKNSRSLPHLIPNLPNEIALSCIARVRRSSHPYLPLVSRCWRTLLRSPVFYDVRSQFGSTQSFIYITVRALNSSSFQWLMLDPRAPNPKKLRPLSPPRFPSAGSACVVLGPRIFVIGGSVSDSPSPSVWIFDARFNRWEMGPSMRTSREFAAAGVVDGKIYVLGGCLVSLARSSPWAEVFDPAVGSWASVPSPAQVQKKRMHGSAVLGGKLFAMADRGGVVFDPAVETCEAWPNVSTKLWSGWRFGNHSVLGRAAVVDGILYCYDYLGQIRGYDDKEDKWEEVKGIDKELAKSLCGATLTDLEGRLCVVWEEKGRGKEMKIGCGEIVVVRESGGGGGLRGSFVWSDVVDLAVPGGSTIVNCLSVAL